MATFTVDFLGCKVSQTDAQEIRERLIADGHLEAGTDAAEVERGAAARVMQGPVGREVHRHLERGRSERLRGTGRRRVNHLLC